MTKTTTTISLRNFDPNEAPLFARDESLSWPEEIHVLTSGRAKAVHPCYLDQSYLTLDALLGEYQIDSDHLVEWLSSAGQEELAELVAVNTRGAA